ncbi:hypothetical protein L915_16158 [Phytophthora nicotianae]|uniref:Reverse transcriptase domain-containing protein n=1 Tax=Phytophthora nicotianae TaxID=4792 RepID=W2G3S9_PHYNI|nr:hypothetical protein L915_16158 [Phytophthora nicotianae]
MEQFEERRVVRSDEERVQVGGEPARVSLVQHRDAERKNVDSVVYVGADDELPTSLMSIDGVQRSVKLDSGARYIVAGTDWVQFGDGVETTAPVDYVEGIGGVLLDVVGVWHFNMYNVFDGAISVDACIVQGCTDEFLLGVDFHNNEIRYSDGGRRLVIPFMTLDKAGGAKITAVRMARRTRLDGTSVTPVEVAITADDGAVRAHAVRRACDVGGDRDESEEWQAINSSDEQTRLPAKRELGTWIPIDENISVLGLGNVDEPLANEEDVHIGETDAESRRLELQLLRAYRKTTENTDDCPLATMVNIEHYIDTGDEAPIMMKRRRIAQTEDVTVEYNEEDGEVRFCIDYRALNKVTNKDVYLLPPIDETLEALGSALLFTTLDLKAGYWQIHVAAKDKVKTAFMTKQGLYQFMISWSLLVVVSSVMCSSWRACWSVWRLRASHKLKKCVFATTMIECLEHELSSDGVRPLERLVTAVKDFPRPVDAAEVKRFVHLAGYYRRFIDGFGFLMAPMTKLLRKNAPWE